MTTTWSRSSLGQLQESIWSSRRPLPRSITLRIVLVLRLLQSLLRFDTELYLLGTRISQRVRELHRVLLGMQTCLRAHNIRLVASCILSVILAIYVDREQLSFE